MVRGLAGIVSHALFSAIFCAGLMWVITKVRGERQVVRGVLTMLMAMVFHFVWDDKGGISGGNTLLLWPLMVVIGAIEVVVLFYVLRHAASTERACTRDLLTPEVETGTLDSALLDAVSGLHRDRKAYRKQLHNRRAASHRIDAAHDLAHEIALARGTTTPQLDHARAEPKRLQEPAPSAARPLTDGDRRLG